MAGPGISTKNTEQIPPGPKFWAPRKYQKSTPEIQKVPVLRIFLVVSGYLLGLPEFRDGGVFFRFCPWKVWVSASGVSVAGLEEVGKFLQIPVIPPTHLTPSSDYSHRRILELPKVSTRGVRHSPVDTASKDSERSSTKRSVAVMPKLSSASMDEPSERSARRASGWPFSTASVRIRQSFKLQACNFWGVC